MVKTLKRKTVHGPSQIATCRNLLCKERKLHELLIIDQLAKDPPCSLNRDHGPIGFKPRINGRYDLREVEPSNHYMSRTYCDRRIRIFTNAY